MFDFGAIANIVLAVGRMSPSGVRLVGSAFCLNKPGFFATVSHVAGTDENGLVLCFKRINHLNDYQDTADTSIQTLPVKIVATDPFHDLAILKANTPHSANLVIAGSDDTPVGTSISSFGFPHADHGRMVLTRQDTDVGARILITAGGVKSKHVVLNVQARPGQSGSPVFRSSDGRLVAVLVGSYAPGGGGGISLGGIDPHTLHQTTHAVSSEYLTKMY